MAYRIKKGLSYKSGKSVYFFMWRGSERSVRLDYHRPGLGWCSRLLVMVGFNRKVFFSDKYIEVKERPPGIDIGLWVSIVKSSELSREQRQRISERAEKTIEEVRWWKDMQYN